MRLDHLLSKVRKSREKMCFTVELSREESNKASGADAVGGHTRSHPEHDG